jgi:hypothetical protein
MLAAPILVGLVLPGTTEREPPSVQLFQVRGIPELGIAIATPRKLLSAQHVAVLPNPREVARTPTGTRLAVLGVVDIVQVAFMLGPPLGAAVGYVLDGATGATSGFVIPIGPLVLAWLFGGR